MSSLNLCDDSYTELFFMVFFSVPGGEEGEEGGRGERQRWEGSRPVKWPPPGEWHGKHDAVRGGEDGQECDAGMIGPFLYE